MFWFTVAAVIADTLTTAYALSLSGVVESNPNVAALIASHGTTLGLLAAAALRILGLLLLLWFHHIAVRHNVTTVFSTLSFVIVAGVTWLIVASNLSVIAVLLFRGPA